MWIDPSKESVRDPGKESIRYAFKTQMIEKVVFSITISSVITINIKYGCTEHLVCERCLNDVIESN